MKYRRHKKDNYTCIDNHVFRDNSLSMKAKGLLAQIYSLPDDWEYSVKGLTSLFSDGKDAVNSALQELIDHGYIIRTQRINKSGKFDGYEYDIYETPQTEKAEKPITENPSTDNPITEKSTQLNTKEENTKKENTELKEESKKTLSFDAILDSVPVIRDNPSLRDTFIEYIKMRKLIKHPLTDRALQLNINEAYKLSKGDPVIMQKLVEQSISRSYRGIFPLDEEKKKPMSTPQAQNDGLNEFGRMLIEEGYA